MTTQYAIGSTYSFNTFAPDLLGTNFQNCVVAGIMDSGSVQQLGFDVIGNNKQVYPSLPAGTPSDPTKYTYLRLKMQSGVYNAIAVPWIDDSSVQLITAQNLNVLIANVDPAVWQDRVRLALVQMGLNDLEFTIV